VDVERTELPGIGVRFEFETKRGAHLGIVAHREGRRDFILYDPDDPDTGAEIGIVLLLFTLASNTPRANSWDHAHFVLRLPRRPFRGGPTVVGIGVDEPL
jgi:hypothetical protein